MKTKSSTLRHPVCTAALMAALLALPSALHAVTYTWDGGGASPANWGVAGNWAPDGTPIFNNVADLSFNVTTNGTMWLGFTNRLVRSLSFGADVDSAMSVSYNGNNATPYNLTLQADAGNASINIASGSTGNITLGNGGLGSAYGNTVLGSNLEVVHNGSGLLLFNRPISGAFDITKTGTGTMEIRAFNTNFTGALNINEGTVISGAQAATGQDLNTASSINLGGGTLHIRPNFANRTYDTAPVVVGAASTLIYENQNEFSYNLAFTGTGAFALNDNLTVRNI